MAARRSACSANHVWQSVRISPPLCCVCVLWRSIMPAAKNQVPITAQPEPALPRTSSRPPLSCTCAHTRGKRHTSVTQYSQGPIIGAANPQDRSEPADSTWCASDRAARTHLQRYKSIFRGSCCLGNWVGSLSRFSVMH